MRCLICIATLHENDKTAFFGDLFIMLVRYQSIWKKYLFIIYYMYVHVSFSCQHSPTVSLEANDLLFCPFKALLLVNLIKERYMYELSLDQAVFSNVQSDQLLWVTTSHFNIPKFRGNVFGAILGQSKFHCRPWPWGKGEYSQKNWMGCVPNVLRRLPYL